MTNEKAHEILENRQRELSGSFGDKRSEDNELVEANGLAILALEKQIPKRVKISITGTAGWNTRCRCPVCGCDVVSHEYCPKCGQRLMHTN